MGAPSVSHEDTSESVFWVTALTLHALRGDWCGKQVTGFRNGEQKLLPGIHPGPPLFAKEERVDAALLLFAPSFLPGTCFLVVQAMLGIVWGAFVELTQGASFWDQIQDPSQYGLFYAGVSIVAVTVASLPPLLSAKRAPAPR